ncbi:hypothetical protein CRENBAI_021454 [Crenichthys baileyi]|uniref:Uncharacterized protein n=1 Tax=Crenichthys baileyi TaxID=28760 RepID=A0AAV9RIG3_9TELE
MTKRLTQRGSSTGSRGSHRSIDQATCACAGNRPPLLPVPWMSDMSRDDDVTHARINDRDASGEIGQMERGKPDYHNEHKPAPDTRNTREYV